MSTLVNTTDAANLCKELESLQMLVKDVLDIKLKRQLSFPQPRAD